MVHTVFPATLLQAENHVSTGSALPTAKNHFEEGILSR